MVANIEQYDEQQWIEPAKTLDDYLSILRRRLPAIILVGGILGIVSLVAALLWPPTYRSTATILIEKQDIPTDLVRSTITSYADQRIQVITTRVMTRTNLLKIIGQYDLYKKQREFDTNDEIVDRMREDTHLNMISADVVDPVSGRPTSATIAFSLSYDGDDPRTVLKVTNRLTSLYLDENLRSRAEKASEASSFLATEAGRLSERISGLEGVLAVFKEEHGETLPEYKELNYQLLESTKREVLDTENQIRALQDRKFSLEGQLAQINPLTPMFSASGERIFNSEDQLKVLETEIVRLRNRYQAAHPDVVKMEGEIEALRKETQSVDLSTEHMAELTRLRTDLVGKQDRYKDNHPDIVSLKKAIVIVQEKFDQSLDKKGMVPLSVVDPENPAFITLNAQLLSVEDDLKAYRTRVMQQQKKQVEFERRLTTSPSVEREYLVLVRDYENAVLKFREIKDKQIEAEISQKLETENKGERFSLVDPPTLPEEPFKPNRPVVAFLGLLLSCGAGLGFGFLREALAGSVNSLRDLAGLQYTAPLVAIPYRENELEQRRKKNKKKLIIGIVVTLGIITLVLIHYFLMPLDLIGYRIQRKLSLM
ncbi:MAG: lipopolysaccharide biosynthesis protein [Methylococcales bacterium]